MTSEGQQNNTNYTGQCSWEYVLREGKNASGYQMLGDVIRS